MNEWQKVESKVGSLREVGDSVEGILVSMEDSTQYPDRKNYHIDTGKEGIITIFGSTALDTKISVGITNKTLSIGGKIKIVYLGEKKSAAGRNYKDFEVFGKSDGSPKKEVNASPSGHGGIPSHDAMIKEAFGL